MSALLHHHAIRQAQERGDAVAVVHDGARVTFGELDAASSRLAAMLRHSGCRPGDRVALLLEKSPTALVAMLGALKARCAYIPMDLASPPVRLGRVLSAGDPRVLLAEDGASAGVLDSLLDAGVVDRGIRIGWLGREPAPERRPPTFGRGELESAPPYEGEGGSPDDIAHILFTSGSTGEPKGVPITHANVAAFIGWAVPYFGIASGDRVSGQPPLHFDLSTFDIYGSLSAGAELHLVPASANLNPRGLARFIRDAELSQWFSVPSVLTYMARFNAVAQDDFPALERLLWCGEVLPTPILKYWMERLPHVTFTNLYGPTEATIASSYHTLTAPPADEREDIPIGRACAGEGLLVLDEQLHELPAGEIGDLFITGAGLSPGYWRDEERTRAVFLTDLPGRPGVRAYRTGDLASMDDDGLVRFHGRADTQIKSRGYRIELGEIETALHTLAELNESAVVAVPSDGFEGTAICCAYAPTAGRTIPPAEVRQRLTPLIPAYMLPMRWLALERLPKNANGKIDRPALRAMFVEGHERQPADAARRAAGADSRAHVTS